MNFADYFLTISGVATLVLLLTEILKQVFRFSGETLIRFWQLKITTSQAVSWVIAMLCATAGYFFDLGLFVDLALWQSLVAGVGIGLIANGIADTKVVLLVLGLFNIKSR